MKQLSSFLLIIFCSVFYTNGQTREIYISDAGNFNNGPWQILKFDEQGQNPVVFTKDQIAWPQDILFLEDKGVVLISNLNTGRITRHDASTGAFLSNFAAGIGGPTRMKIGPDSLLYVLQWNGTGKVKRYQLDGTFVDDFTSVGVSQSIGLDWDQSGNLYVSSYGGKLVRKFDTAGQDSGIFISANLLGPTNIWFDVNGDLLVTDYNGTAVKRFDHSGTYLGDFITGLSKAEGVAFLPDGHILIGNGASKSVKEFDAGGAYVGERISGGSGGLLTPNAVVIREVASSGLNEIDRHQWAVTPSLGVEFKLSIPETMDVQMVAVYDMLGNVVEELSASSTGTWNAQDHPQGIYLIAVATSDGLMTSHRVVVKRN